MNKLYSGEFVKLVEEFIGEKLPSDTIFKIAADPGRIRVEYYVTDVDGKLMLEGGGPLTASVEYPFLGWAVEHR